ncbi:hypothetical protein JIG36_51030 [Actinoplanes sp. LDG1-06]|uniref:Uncharacterized protein n=1 Tax=Paractinoplanes ovalisporus TaxID=2810368 RepID=A0ABS2AXF0_9ACTN|nr:hypothetical protein [Actinoplanes ovalisporus]MBM2623854.1 hypothetical protein [Actinoplanes ovalisporus]
MSLKRVKAIDVKEGDSLPGAGFVLFDADRMADGRVRIVTRLRTQLLESDADAWIEAPEETP